jgi:hypothetical protein
MFDLMLNYNFLFFVGNVKNIANRHGIFSHQWNPMLIPIDMAIKSPVTDMMSTTISDIYRVSVDSTDFKTTDLMEIRNV